MICSAHHSARDHSFSPREQDFELVESETPEQLVHRLDQNGLMKPPASYEDRAKNFFAGRQGEYLLYAVDSGRDSFVYLLWERASNVIGLIKLYDPENTPLTVINQYRALTDNVIAQLEVINSKLNATATIGGVEYSIRLQVMPVGEPIETNGVIGVVLDRSQCVKGTNLDLSDTAMNKGCDRSYHYRWVHLEDVSEGPENGTMLRVPDPMRFFLPRDFRKQLARQLGQHTGRDTLAIEDANIKFRVDRGRRILYVVTTDLADSIRDLFPFENAAR